MQCRLYQLHCHVLSMWQGGEQQGSGHGADLTPSPRTGAIVDALLEGVVSDNLATGDTPLRARQQPPRTHTHGVQQGALQTLMQCLWHACSLCSAILRVNCLDVHKDAHVLIAASASVCLHEMRQPGACGPLVRICLLVVFATKQCMQLSRGLEFCQLETQGVVWCSGTILL